MNNKEHYRYKPLVTIAFYDDKLEEYSITHNGKLRFVPREEFERDYEKVNKE